MDNSTHTSAHTDEPDLAVIERRARRQAELAELWARKVIAGDLTPPPPDEPDEDDPPAKVETIVDPAIELAWSKAHAAEEMSRQVFAAATATPAEPMSAEDAIREHYATCSMAEVLPDDEPEPEPEPEPTTASAIAEDRPAAPAPFGAPWVGDDDPIAAVAELFEQLFAREPSTIARLLAALSTCDARQLAKLFQCPLRDAGEAASDAPNGPPTDEPDEAGVLWRRPGSVTDVELANEVRPEWDENGRRLNPSPSVFPRQVLPRGSHWSR